MALPVPLILRGRKPAAESSYPTWISQPPASIFATLAGNWAVEPDSPQRALNWQPARPKGPAWATSEKGADAALEGLALQAIVQMRAPDGPRVAVLDYVGFDTHAQEPGEYNDRLGAVDRAISMFRNRLPPEVWEKTLILTVTEFGRTVVENGSWGSDHGWGSCSLVVAAP